MNTMEQLDNIKLILPPKSKKLRQRQLTDSKGRFRSNKVKPQPKRAESGDFKIFRNFMGQLMIQVACPITGKLVNETANCSELHLRQVANHCRTWNAGAVEICLIAESRSSKAASLRRKRYERSAAIARIDESMDAGFLALTSDLRLGGFLK